jgi:hypothetical protein
MTYPEFPLNKIIQNGNGYTCIVFQLDIINVGGLFISSEQFDDITVHAFDNCSFRYYRRSRKIVISSSGQTEYEYAAINLSYTYWKCLICKKVNKRSEPSCFCNTYSICWTPIDGEITGILFQNNDEFKYHFDDNSLSNLII